MQAQAHTTLRRIRRPQKALPSLHVTSSVWGTSPLATGFYNLSSANSNREKCLRFFRAVMLT